MTGRLAARRRRNQGDRGSATIWVVACCVLVLVAGSVGAVRAAAVVARHRAESAADLAALAAAAQIGVSTSGCAAAARIADRNGVRLVTCRPVVDPGGRSGTVVVAVEARVRLPFAGAQVIAASARAGRLPAAVPPRAVGRPAGWSAPAEPTNRVTQRRRALRAPGRAR